MTPDRLAEVLESLADGPPWDTTWLRSLLPELAVRGRLVAQEAGADWVTGSFDELGTVNPKVKRDEDDLVAGFLPMANVPDFLGGPIGFERKTWGGIKKGYTRFEEGDLLVAKITPCFQNGKACVARGVPGGVGAGTTELYVFRPHPDLGDVDFFHLLVRTPEFVQGGVDTFTGTAGQQRVAKGYFAGHSWSVPPLAEQHRIVAKVDELMGHAAVVEARHLAASSARVRFRDAALHALAEAEDHEAVGEAWSRIEDHFDDLVTEPEDIQPLRQTILQLAVRGRLVAQEAGDEDIDSVLGAVATERAATGLKAPASGWKSSPVEAGEIYDRVVSSWSWVRLGDLLLDIEAGHSPQALKRSRIEDEWGVLKVSSCSWGQFLPEENKALPTGYLVDTEAEVRDGDLLISRANTVELIARSVAVESPPPRLMLSDKTLRLVSSGGVSNKYLNIANGSATARAHYEKNASGTSASMRNVGQSVICDTPIPLPPLDEQHRIVAKVDELMALCDTLETSLKRAKTTREQFATSISHALSAPESTSALAVPTGTQSHEAH